MNDDELRGKFLTKLRLEKNLTQSDLAKMIGYSDKSISKWERGKCFPKDIETLIKLAEILDISIDDLLQLEYSDVEGKSTPHLNNKFLNFLFQNRLFFIIIFIIIILLFLGYLIFFVYIPSTYDRKIYDKENIKNINGNLDVIYSGNNVNNYDINDEENKDDISNDKVNFDIERIHKVLVGEGFKYSNFIYSKQIKDRIFIEYYEINNYIKIYDRTSLENLYLLNSSIKYDFIFLEKYVDKKHEIEYIKIDDIKNCNLEKCDSYLDYAMYINYIKKLILK